MSLPRSLLELRDEGKLLTPRHREVLRLYGQGFTRGQIAQRLWLSEETVKSHTASARARLRANTVTHAVAIAMSLELI